MHLRVSWKQDFLEKQLQNLLYSVVGKKTAFSQNNYTLILCSVLQIENETNIQFDKNKTAVIKYYLNLLQCFNANIYQKQWISS